MDRILIEALTVETVIGVYDWERTITQSLSLDLSLATDIRPAAATDDLRLTLDYAAICQRIQQFADEHQFALVETFAERLAASLQHEFPISWLHMRVRKPGAVPQAASVGLEITRGSLPKNRKDSDP
ncbi:MULTISPECIES: dihydroneopterin aldolase [Halomonadaceae]|uniref:7,8-dihydroneopterin aldolase n=2 Tax=Halomonadaceae TaxID=28256 RepID=A0A8H9MAK9_9GAMM|nr:MULTISPECIES: dihydroneopterin aldolase [Halomonas]ATH76353.1 dihydroneopterin aldolase [Halomonas hydrothermalis]KHJ52377.1 dihydroneopterin aldolase [Halomonas hydrothermalis]MDM7481326.1 dihydroneopterin aldolase [Halomonas sp.]UDM08126.1 dihydroneopterin aldolase [Halomonas sp. NyZ770]GGW60916.1 7,8-dihydroneopterin aldolase [Halomonas johnsoniae]